MFFGAFEKNTSGYNYMKTICYKNLWKLLIDRDMKKKDLQRLSGISSASITKLGKNENVSTDTLVKICIALDCDICDIVSVIDDE